jgi:hypothetical protein
MPRYNWTKELQTQRPQYSFRLYEYTQEVSTAFKVPCCLIHRKYPIHRDIHFEPFYFDSWGMDREQITAEDCSLVTNYAEKFDFDQTRLSSFYSFLKAARLHAKYEELGNE